MDGQGFPCIPSSAHQPEKEPLPKKDTTRALLHILFKLYLVLQLPLELTIFPPMQFTANFLHQLQWVIHPESSQCTMTTESARVAAHTHIHVNIYR